MSAHTTPLVRYSTLSAGGQWLVRHLQHVNYGRITFTVRGGRPHPADGYRLAHTHKLDAGADNGPRPQLSRGDFVLRDAHLNLFRHLATFADGTRVTVKVAAGLPATTLEIEEDHVAA